ncbi:MAG: TRAP transporter large permease [Spirochaetales bacterium]|jgi:C4-dicarboxylate transporter DctM subunit|nr:TRAP transporter large permease [Spirochaetales bacterium]
MLSYLIGTLIFCFIFNVPIGFALGVATSASMILGGSNMSLALIPQRMVAGVNSFPLLAIPFFMMAGAVMERGGVSKRIVHLSNACVGHIKGGLAAVSILACTFFAAISGSTPATAAAVGSLTIPEMEKRGYGKDYAAAVVAAAGCLGVIIPPSITMVVFGVIANVSIGKLLIGGIVPGCILSAILLITNLVCATRAGYATEIRKTLKEALLAFKDAVWALLMPIIILGGIMSGVFTPTESAAIAVLYGLIVGFFVYKELTPKDIVPIFYKSALNSAMIMLLIGTANPFGWVMTSLQVPTMVSNLMLSITTNALGLFFMIMVLLLILGTFMETAAILMLVVPMVAPLMQNAGVDMVHFGVLTVIALAVGMATPPVGIALFATCSIAKVSIGQISRKIIPFLLALLVGLIILVLIPKITTFLPNLMIK